MTIDSTTLSQLQNVVTNLQNDVNAAQAILTSQSTSSNSSSNTTSSSTAPGSTITAPASGQSLTDSANNVWSFGATGSYGYNILKNGTQFAGGSGTVLTIDINGVVWVKNNVNVWYMTTSSGFTQETNGPTT